MNPLLLLFAIPALVVALGLLRRAVRWLPRVAAGLMLAQLPLVVWICLPALQHTVIPRANFGLDGVGAAFLVITTLVAAAAFFQAAFLIPAEQAEDRHQRLFYVLAGLFLIAMYCVLLAQNLGYLWIAMEATTLMSAPLVYFHRTRHALEAAWKYLLLCSVGIAFALFGTVLLVAAQHGAGHDSTLLYRELLDRVRDMDPRLLRLGFIFCLLGYGTKAGIFPLHNWLPDAHSEAPAPASAMLSGALLNCALVAIWRLSQLMVTAGQGDLVRELLVPAGAITVLAAGIMLVRQHGLKRMWAYSSVEHVGLLVLAIGLGSGPIFILHALNHSLVKVALFLLAGVIMHLFGTKILKKLSGILKAAPLYGVLLIAGTFAIAGSPPFGTFLSEWLLLQAAFTAGEWGAAIMVIIGLTVAFVALMTHVGRMLFGPAPDAERLTVSPAWGYAPAVLLAGTLVTGVALSPPVMALLTALAPVGGLAR